MPKLSLDWIGQNKDATIALDVTHCGNICLLNYANDSEVVSTFFPNDRVEYTQSGSELFVWQGV